MAFLLSDGWAADDKPVDSAGVATSAADVKLPYELSPEKMMMDNFLFIGMIVAIIFFVVIRPQQMRVKQHGLLVKSLQKGNKIVTSGGLYGTITKFEGDDVVIIEIAPSIKVRVARSSVSEVVTKTPGAGENANDN